MKPTTTEDAIRRGLNSRKMMQIAKNEFGENAVTLRRLNGRISEAERKVKVF